MRRFLSNLVRVFQTAKTARAARRAPRRSMLQLEVLEERLALSTASPVGFQPLFVLAPHQTSSQTALSSAVTPPGYSPEQIRDAYGINNSLDTGAGQTIAIVDAYNDPKIFSDLDVFDKQFAPSAGNTFFQQFGTASSFLTVFNQNGQVINPASTSVPVDPTGNWEIEESLDVEWAHAVAPGAKIDLVEANNNNNLFTNNSNLLTAVASAAGLPGVSAVSMSWGSGEDVTENDHDVTFTTPAGHTGVTFLASTGDNSAGEYPAFSPNVVAVGGTTLKLNTNDTIQSETAWSTGSDSWNKSLGTGGGFSNHQEAEPSYQQGFQSTGFRTIPDVSFDADPNTGVAVYDSFGTSSAPAPGWEKIGGTSLATPAWAGLIAMANQQRAAVGLPTLNSTSPTEAQTLLYGLASGHGDGAAAFHDITSGSITANGQTFNAGLGYDEVTGLGSPIANSLVFQLSRTLDLVGDTNPGYPDDSFAISTTASGGIQITNTNGVTESFAPGVLGTVNINAGTGINTISVIALPLGVSLNLDNNTPGHNDNVSIGSNETSLSNIAGTVNVANSGGTTALGVYGTADGTGRDYQLFAAEPNVEEVHASGGPAVFYSGDINSLTIKGGSGNNSFDVETTAVNVPVSINAGSGTNDVFIARSNSAVNITGSGTNYVTVGTNGSLATIAGPVNISNTSNANGGDGKSYVTIDDGSDTTGRNYTISSSSIAVQGGPTITLSSDVAGLTFNDAVGKANSYTVNSVSASDPVTINGDALDELSGPAAGQVTFNKHAHS